ncbi:MAG: hypothetical protein HOG49_04545 [Candidatus Scalindua sp.]|jgi:hypothetical protein|nr:hypothetical protein [Candidatus Scalindua sp.]
MSNVDLNDLRDRVHAAQSDNTEDSGVYVDNDGQLTTSLSGKPVTEIPKGIFGFIY